MSSPAALQQLSHPSSGLCTALASAAFFLPSHRTSLNLKGRFLSQYFCSLSAVNDGLLRRREPVLFRSASVLSLFQLGLTHRCVRTFVSSGSSSPYTLVANSCTVTSGPSPSQRPTLSTSKERLLLLSGPVATFRGRC